MIGEQKPWWYLAHAEDDLNLRFLRMLEGTFFSLEEAQGGLQFYSDTTADLNLFEKSSVIWSPLTNYHQGPYFS